MSGDLMCSITAEDVEIFKKELIQLEKSHDELEAQIKKLNDKLKEIDKEYSIRKGKIESYKLLHSLENVNDSNSMTVFCDLIHRLLQCWMNSTTATKNFWS